MNFNEYQKKAAMTAVYPNIGNNIEYPALGLASEAGEVAGKVKKIQRDYGGNKDGSREAVAKELGGVLWYVAQLATEFGLSLQDIAETNVGTLAQRAEEGTLKGNDLDDVTAYVTRNNVPDKMGNIFAPGCMKLPPEGTAVKLSYGDYGTDATKVIGTAKLFAAEHGYGIRDIRIASTSPITAVTFASALEHNRVSCVMNGDVEDYTVISGGHTRVTNFKLRGIDVSIANLAPGDLTGH